MIGLKRGIIRLETYDENWNRLAYDSIQQLKTLFKKIAIDIQHIGSTAIDNIHAKPIIDLVVGVENLDKVNQFFPSLEKENIIFRGQDVSNQLLFVMEDTSRNVRTHHIHIVIHNKKDWNNYINFRDYLNANPIKAKEYERLKIDLTNQYPTDRNAYTHGKNLLINELLLEAEAWAHENYYK